jgi:hypothetical protein
VSNAWVYWGPIRVVITGSGTASSKATVYSADIRTEKITVLFELAPTAPGAMEGARFKTIRNGEKVTFTELHADSGAKESSGSLIVTRVDELANRPTTAVFLCSKKKS